MTRLSGYRRDGFTLIELLVVISIIGVLVALTTAAVMKGRDAVVRADNGWRMEQVTIAANSFGTSAELSQPGYLPQPPFRLRKNYYLADNVTLDSVSITEASYLKRLFPNLNLLDTGLAEDSVLVDGNQVAVFFLTGGAMLEYQGFARGQKPFTAKKLPDEQRIGPFLQLKLNSYSIAPPAEFATPNSGTIKHAWLLDPYGVPYAVFMAGPKGNYGAQMFPAGPTLGQPNKLVVPYYRQSPVTSSNPSPPIKYENPKTIQIISAGQNKGFWGGGNWEGATIAFPGDDDKSNFSTAIIGAGPQ